jgi:hypothetical protein
MTSVISNKDKLFIKSGGFIFLLLLSITATAQTPACNCRINLDTLIAKTERNYAGFPAKATAQNSNTYQVLKKKVQTKASGITQPKQCFYVLKEYVNFFYDRHFNLTYYNENDFDIEIIPVAETAFRKQFNTQNRHALEGIWQNQDSSVTVGISKQANGTFKAIVLSSKNEKLQQGLVYMTITPGKRSYTVKYYNSFSSTDYPIQLKGNLLQGWSEELFGKIFPEGMTQAELQERNTWRNYNNGLHFYKLSAQTAVLKIPTFANNDEKIAQLIQQHDSVIRSTKNLIVDLTGNSGGSTGWVSMLGYFMTKPIVQQNGFVRVSPQNIKAKLADIEPFVVNPVPDEYKKYFPDATLNAYKKAFAELPVTNLPFYPVPGVVFPLDSITVYPEKIALVVDELCGSSTEYFFFLSKESGKTTRWGVPTVGMMDYQGAGSEALPYADFRVSIPIVKSSWTDKKPIDKTGFTPDVLLNKIKPEHRIRYIQKQMEK